MGINFSSPDLAGGDPGLSTLESASPTAPFTTSYGFASDDTNSFGVLATITCKLISTSFNNTNKALVSYPYLTVSAITPTAVFPADGGTVGVFCSPISSISSSSEVLTTSILCVSSQGQLADTTWS